MNDQYAIGYYTEPDRPFFNALATNYTTLDRFFSSISLRPFRTGLSSTPRRPIACRTPSTSATIPTIWDRRRRERRERALLLPRRLVLLAWGLKYLPIHGTYDSSSPTRRPARSRVCVREPRFIGDEAASRQRPSAPDIRVGDAFLAETFQAVASSPNWSSTVFVVTYDEWAGSSSTSRRRARSRRTRHPDVVAARPSSGSCAGGRGVAVLTRDSADPRWCRGCFDHTSILKLIEWRWTAAAHGA